MDKDYLDAKVEAVKAINDKEVNEIKTSIEQVDGNIRQLGDKLSGEIRQLDDHFSGEIRRLDEKIDKMPGHRTIWAAALSVFLGILGVLAFGGDRFNGGMSAASLVIALREDVQANADAIQANANAIDALSQEVKNMAAAVTTLTNRLGEERDSTGGQEE